MEQPERDSEEPMTVTEPSSFSEALDAATAEHAPENAGGDVPEVAPTGEAEVVEPPEAPVAPTETYTVKVNGIDTEVSLEEALNGYQRQSDYTQKTQALAAEQARLAQAEQIAIALEQDPKAALARLAELYEVGPLTPVVADEDMDPLERDVLETKAWIAQQQEREIEIEIDTEIGRIKTAYSDPDIEGDEILRYALDNKIGNLDAAYRAMKFSSVAEATAAATTATREAEEAAVLAAKQEAAVVEGGSTRQAAAPLGGGRAETVRDAFEFALNEHGA